MSLIRPLQSTLSLGAAACLIALTPALAGAAPQAFSRPSVEDVENAKFMEVVPEEVLASHVIQRVDNQVPLGAEFIDSSGKVRVLSEILAGEVPVLLTMNYSNCPQLCSMVLNSVVNNLRGMSLEPDEDYKLITISVDPLEDPERMAATKARYVKSLEREGAEAGWTFLRGTKPAIDSVANAVGFGYVQVEGTGADGAAAEYSHPATLIVLTPEGRVSLYLTAINDDPQTVRLALVDASDGAIGNVMDLFFTNCFRYDATKGRYGPIARRILALAGVVFAFGFASLLITFRVLEKRRHVEDTEQ